MSDYTKKPLITKWSDDTTATGSDTGLTARAVQDIRVIEAENTKNMILSMTGLVNVDGSPLDNPPPILLRNKDNRLVVNDVYNPGVDLYFNGQLVGYGMKQVNMAGTVTCIQDPDDPQSVKIQIGDNMNSSSWNSEDGKGSNALVSRIPTTNGACPDTTGAPYNTGDWAINSLVPFTKANNISFKSSGNVHLFDGPNTWTITVFGENKSVILRKATLTDTVVIDYTNDDIVGGGSVGIVSSTNINNNINYEVGNSGITTSYVNFAVEDNFPSSVGCRYLRTWNFDLRNILPEGGRMSILIEGCGGRFTQTDFFYLVGVTPVIPDTLIELTDEENYKFVSGVRYLTSGTTFTVSTPNVITGLNNQLGSVGNKLTVKDEYVLATIPDVPSRHISAPLLGATTLWNDSCLYRSTPIGVVINSHSDHVRCTLTPHNAYTNGTLKHARLDNVLVNTYSTASTDLIEYFQTESRRIVSNTLLNWSEGDKATSLVNTNELQVIPSIGLKYPVDNHLNDIPARINYSICTGTRYFTRKFIKAGSLPGASLLIEHAAAIRAGLENNSMKLSASKNGVTWFDISFVSPNNQLGTSNSTWGATSSRVIFNWNDGDANGWFYFKVTMNKGNNSIIKKITLE